MGLKSFTDASVHNKDEGNCCSCSQVYECHSDVTGPLSRNLCGSLSLWRAGNMDWKVLSWPKLAY